MAVVCAGELLVDGQPDGSAQPGGAPANVAFHARALGHPSSLLSRLGTDEDGSLLRDWLGSSGVDDRLCQTDARHRTGAVRIGMLPSGGPFYDIMAPAAWDFLEATGPALDAAGQADVFVYGTLAQRHPESRRAIRTLAQAALGGGGQVLADLNLRAPFYDDETVLWTLRHCHVLKLNHEELAVVSHLLGAAGCGEDLFTGLLREFGIGRGVLTAGADGAWIFEDGSLVHQPAVPAVQVDPVGAGDAFCAALAVGVAAGRTLRDSAPRAARAAAFVVSRHGAAPPLPPEI